MIAQVRKFLIEKSISKNIYFRQISFEIICLPPKINDL